jgi:hypothetical protein
VNIDDTNGWTPLHLAAMGVSDPNRAQRIAITEILVSAGADISATDNVGLTPLDYASDPIVVETLLGYGAKCTKC